MFWMILPPSTSAMVSSNHLTVCIPMTVRRIKAILDGMTFDGTHIHD